MAEIFNLNKARKARAKQQAERDAAANRLAFGRTAAEKQADREAEEQRRRLLDGARLDDSRDRS
ncbi:DUF4169 family protein [Rhodovarius crocodyli]|uniref:DUF4169 family protein n=1 Tax=Rhodovarius crocodyli TaxID=1979269 RepID=A0A437MPV6_9PROT|nr:DUF4169 family protein [Rhodovarius crocodyli]RVT99672.1 DUF4169 family protein [Rhodovarius crocodyli]